MIYRKNYLVHHGILGQKWGKKNGPPYPLGASDHSASEKKAGWRKSLDKKSDSGDSNTRKGLTDKQKKILKNVAIGTGVTVGALLLAYGGYKLYQHNKITKLGSDAVGDILGNLDAPKIKTLSDPELHTAAMNINPTESKTNCGSCATAIVANLNGGDYQALDKVPMHMRNVSSSGIPREGYDPQKLIDCFEGAEWENCHGNNRKELAKTIKEKILSYGEGANGIIYPDEYIGMKHSHYSAFVVRKGEVCILEGQAPALQSTGVVYDGDTIPNALPVDDNIFMKFNPGVGDVHIARLDNHPIKPGRETDLYKNRSKST